jgi:hypothetical protein
MTSAGKLILVGAAVLAVVGLVALLLGRLGVHGLPGTLSWRSRSGNVNVYFPLGLMILASIAGTILLNVFFRR